MKTVTGLEHTRKTLQLDSQISVMVPCISIVHY